jgi:hypothetical protein
MKRIQSTSGIVHEHYNGNDHPAQERIREDLIEFTALRGGDLPTSGELTDHLVQLKRAFDVNSVRPYLTWLNDRGRVKKAGKRRCSRTGITCFVWQAI